MNFAAAFLIFAALFLFVVGQLLLKRAMDESERTSWRSPRFVPVFASGIAAMTVSFFITLGLLGRFELSYLYPFQGLSVIIIAAAGAMMLREKISLQLWLGSLLISAGIVLVSLS